MKLSRSGTAGLTLAAAILTAALATCDQRSVPGSPGVPEPIKVLENPQTGERARFFQEIWFKRPRGYHQKEQLATWTAAQQKLGFTQEIAPEADRERWAELRARNRAAAGQATATKPHR